MAQKLAVKRLTASDLTLFQWHFQHRNAGNQKAINLNADIFIENLYPRLPGLAQTTDNRLPLFLYIYGPGLGVAYPLLRKIVKGATYKNWRLNGEFIINPSDEPDRFNILEPEDFAVFDFDGELTPESARIVFIAAKEREDSALHSAFNQLLGSRKMLALTSKILNDVITQSQVTEDHPIYELLLENALEDAAQGGIEGIRRLQKRTKASNRKITAGALQKARENAGKIGGKGEDFINYYFTKLLSDGVIQGFEWTSLENAISAFDFWVDTGKAKILVDVKSTESNFENSIHISYNELLQMRDAIQYDLYRVYAINNSVAQLRIAANLKGFAQNILQMLEQLPPGVRTDSISVSPSILPFGDPIYLDTAQDE